MMQMPRSSRPAPSNRPMLLVVLLAALLAAPAALAQDPTPEPAAPPPAHWAAGFRLGVFDMVNAADSYDAVYGDPMPRLGGQVEWNRGRWRFAASLDWGTVDGERVILAGGGNTIGTGLDQELTLAPLHLTAAWRLNPGDRWEWSAGAGPSLLYWQDEGPVDDEGSTDFGGSAVVALRWQRGEATGAAWDFGGELRWSTFPGALDDTGGVTAFFDEDDPGGISLTLLAVRRF